MPLEAIHRFANYLAEREHSLQEILNHLLRVEIKFFDADSIVFFQTNDSGHFSVAGMSGVDSTAASELVGIYSLNDPWAAAHVIRNGQILWLAGENIDVEHGNLIHNFPILIGLEALIVIPVFRGGVTTGALALKGRVIKTGNRDLELYLQVISSIFSMYIYRNIILSPDSLGETRDESPPLETKPDSKSNEPTQRQLMIMQLISDERTNKSISEILGSSESTIRKEILKIFAKTGCTRRNQVAEIYKSKFIKIVESMES